MSPDVPLKTETTADTGPPDLIMAGRPHLHQGERIEATAASELDARGSFRGSGVVLTDRRLLAGGWDGTTFTVERTLVLTDLMRVTCRNIQGACLLEAHTREGAVTLACCPRSQARAFSDIARRAETSMGNDHDDAAGSRRSPAARFAGGGQDSKPCPSCGKPIPQRLGVCPDCLDRRRLIIRLLGRAKPYRLPMFAGLFLMLILTIVEMMPPLLTKILVDNVIPNANLRLFAWIIGGIVAIHFSTALFSGIRSYMMAWLGEAIVHDLRCELYAHLQQLSLDFYDQRQTGWIMDRVSADTSNLQNFLAEGFQDFVRDIMTLVVILGVMFAMNAQLALITLLPAPIVFFLTRRFMRRARGLFHAVWRKRARMSTLLSNVIPGVRVVKAFAREDHETRRFTVHSKRYMSSSIALARAFATFHPVIRFVTALGFVLVWSSGGYQVITSGSVTLGTLIAFISYLWRFYAPVNSLSQFSRRVQRATTAAQRVFDVLDTGANVTEPEDGEKLPDVAGRVEFNNVTFGYDPDLPVLKNVSFTVAPGEMIGFVGPSGAGKSTTINLLCRFYDVDEGSITIDGHDLRQVTTNSLHSQIGVVLQDPFLFHGTIAENIAYSKPNATRLEIIAAARTAHAHVFIMQMPEGYDTLVGERGQRLSGGERQRISIARAILKNPRILILDEATSNIDAETEDVIQKAIRRLVAGRTTLAIAHRFSTLRDADRLIVLDEGGIVEMGTHAELLAREDGVFKRLCDIQQRTSQIVAVGGG